MRWLTDRMSMQAAARRSLRGDGQQSLDEGVEPVAAQLEAEVPSWKRGTPMDMGQLLDLCRRNGYEFAQKAGWMQVGPPGAVGFGSRDPRIFYLSPRYVDLRRESGPVDLVARAIADAPLVGNGQIVARVPYTLFSDAEWERFVTRSAAVSSGPGAQPPRQPRPSSPKTQPAVAAGGYARAPQGSVHPSQVAASPVRRVASSSVSVSGAAMPQMTHEDMLAASIAEMAELLSTPVASPAEEYLDDLVPSLLELADCLAGHYRCRIAAICLSGKILEICLQRILVRENRSFEDQDALYQLVDRVKRASIKMPGGWEEAANLIRQFRNGAIHQRRGNPIPSTEHVTMVVMALKLILEYSFPADLAPRTT